jgi:amino ABC transporter, permease protein, 3-TM region, his/glu/gln/arg/opine family
MLIDKLTANFITENRWKYLLYGLRNTLIITIFALIIGLILGFCVALIINYNKNTGKLKMLSKLCGVYLTVIRGTPIMVQLLIAYYGIFASIEDMSPIIVAIITFGINSGAYQAEIFRSGIESISKGQLEAGRSLGFSYTQTMNRVILPQAVKNILPTLVNEFTSLLKETSVAGYITVMDLTKGGDIIRSITYSPFIPYLAVAFIYLCVVMLLSSLAKCLERSMKKNDAK